MGIRFPLGADDFRKVRQEGCYYVDKTGLIPRLLGEYFETKLITRPRRFGKTLMMSMLEDFFDIGRDSREDFAGLEVMGDHSFCDKWMNKWPVVFLSLKDVDGDSFESAYGMLREVIAALFSEHEFIAGSADAAGPDFMKFKELMMGKGDEAQLKSCLLFFTRMLHAYYGKQVILLIDEYDVPLAKASQNGYYDKMLHVIRGMLGSALKGNRYLKFAVLTGCLRISKESIFTGVNNFTVDSVTDKRLAEYIGFTDSEVEKILSDAGLSGHLEEVRRWYDGYRFGDRNIYCPWDVLNHVNALQFDPTEQPRSYWKNTSGNDVIYEFIDRRNIAVNGKFEKLLSDGHIIEEIAEDLTYRELMSSEKNMWSLLYMTGYLTRADLPDGVPGGRCLALRIPNEEIKSIFKDKIVDWFEGMMKAADRRELFHALWSGDADAVSRHLSNLLDDVISYYDYKEDFYHAFVAGIFAGGGYVVDSNREYGLGRPDLTVRDPANRRALIIETKHADSEESLPEKCDEAIRQIKDRNYAGSLGRRYEKVLCYGIAFCDKECMVRLGT